MSRSNNTKLADDLIKKLKQTKEKVGYSKTKGKKNTKKVDNQ